MAVTQHTRRASCARGREKARFPTNVHPGQLSFVSGLPHLNASKSGSLRKISSIDSDVPHDADTSVGDGIQTLFIHDGIRFRPAPPQQIIEQARVLISQRWPRGTRLVTGPNVVDELLRVRLASEPQTVFAALFLDRHCRLLDFDVLFRGTINGVLIHTREVVREAINRNAEVVIAARNDPTGESDHIKYDIEEGRKMKRALSLVDITLADYLIIGDSIISLVEQGWV